ncbi:MAG: tetratricopeptide repeat protein [Saprospiraceae bacterium]|nr:tetratricopeptide repeat protein [Saprospiraceae bacterium]
MKRVFIVAKILFFSFLYLDAQTLEEGIRQLENENYAAALNTFIKLNVSNPKNSIYAYYLGETHYAMENYKGAKDSYLAGLAANSKSDECKIGLGKLAIDEKNLPEAKKYFDSALRGNSKNHALIAMVGAAYLYNRNPQPKEALEYFTQARDLDPKIVKYWIYKGDAHVANNEPGSAMTAYETAVEKNRIEPETYVKMARIWNSSGKYDLAIEKLETAIKLNPNYAQAYKDLYESYIKSRKIDKVIPVLEKYTSLVGSDIGAKVRLVKFLCYQAKDYNKAIEVGNQIIGSNPEEYTIYRWLAWSYFETGEFEKSYKSNQLLLQSASKSTERKLYVSDYEYLAKSAFKLFVLDTTKDPSKLNLLDTMEWSYNKLIELDSSRELEVYGVIAKAYYDAKIYKKGEEWYIKKNNLKPLNSSELYYLGLCQFFDEAYSRADSSFAKLLELTPNYAQGWIYRAKCNANLDPENVNFLAKPYFEKYIEIASADTKQASVVRNLILSHRYMAYYNVQNNNNELAKMHYSKILELDPTNLEASDNLKLLGNK